MRPSQLLSQPHTRQTTSAENIENIGTVSVPERFREKLALWDTKMRLFTKCDWMNNPTKNEIMVTKEVSQPVISGGPMEEVADDIEDLALEIKDTQPDMAPQVKATSERLLYHRFIRDMDQLVLG
ncbi:hypothetical protein FCOIX_12275 [Fusarium coicis]|nr:hypothetical protein FCOIX_12275 [Fusarium coicis]